MSSRQQPVYVPLRKMVGILSPAWVMVPLSLDEVRQAACVAHSLTAKECMPASAEVCSPNQFSAAHLLTLLKGSPGGTYTHDRLQMVASQEESL